MYTEIQRAIETTGIKAVVQKVQESFRKKKVKISDRKISIRRLWESVVGHPDDTMSFLKKQKGFQISMPVKEADVRVSAMANLVGELLSNEVIESYNKVATIGDKLVETYNSNQRDERLPGFVDIPTDDSDVAEGEAYPEAGLTDKYVLTGEKKKRGLIVNVTEEAIMFDQTGLVVERIKEVADALAQRKEKNILSGICGGHVCYYPSGSGTALYATAPFVVAANALVDWTDIDKAEKDGLGSMVDDNGNEISVDTGKKILLVPLALKYTGKRIVNATENSYGADSDKVKTSGPNILSDENIIVASSRYVAVYTGNDTTWFYGDPTKQFRYKEIYPLQTFTLANNNMLEFDRDIKFSYKVREWGWIFAKDQRYFVKNTA